MIAPQMPGGRAVGQAIFDDQAHRKMHDATRIVTVGVSQVSQVRIEILAAAWTTMLGILNQQVDGMVAAEIAQVVQAALTHAVAICRVPAERARLATKITRTPHDFWRWQILNTSDSFSHIRQVVTRTGHLSISQEDSFPWEIHRQIRCES
jgi:hypothetical protein